jgi:hypothetical protein
LHPKGIDHIGQQVGVQAVVVEHLLGQSLPLEVPEHGLRQAGNRGLQLASKLEGDVVAGQLNLVNLGVEAGFVFPHPLQLGSREVAGRIQEVVQAIGFAQPGKSLVAVGYRAAIAPDDGGAQHLAVLV